MKAHVILETVAKTLTQRGTANGYDKQEERSAAEIARVFNEKTSGAKLTENGVLEVMRALKEVRLKRQLVNGIDPTDTLIDLIGYTALLAECLTEK